MYHRNQILRMKVDIQNLEQKMNQYLILKLILDPALIITRITDQISIITTNPNIMLQMTKAIIN